MHALFVNLFVAAVLALSQPLMPLQPSDPDQQRQALAELHCFSLARFVQTYLEWDIVRQDDLPYLDDEHLREVLSVHNTNAAVIEFFYDNDPEWQIYMGDNRRRNCRRFLSNRPNHCEVLAEGYSDRGLANPFTCSYEWHGGQLVVVV